MTVVVMVCTYIYCTERLNIAFAYSKFASPTAFSHLQGTHLWHYSLFRKV